MVWDLSQTCCSKHRGLAFIPNDPRIIQRGLEYLDKVEDKEKREYILQRLERLQSGQEKIDRKIETNERRRQYDERNRDRNK